MENLDDFERERLLAAERLAAVLLDVGGEDDDMLFLAAAHSTSASHVGTITQKAEPHTTITPPLDHQNDEEQEEGMGEQGFSREATGDEDE